MTEPIIKYGREIGREPADKRWIWATCPGCGHERWLGYVKKSMYRPYPKPDTPCVQCYRKTQSQFYISPQSSPTRAK